MNSMGFLRSGTANRSMVCCGRASIREGEGIEMSSIPQVEALCSGRLVGPMVLTKKGLCACEDSSDWLRDGFSISPFELPLRKGGVAKPSPFGGGFGVFGDCLPDGWGFLILDRYLLQNGVVEEYRYS